MIIFELRYPEYTQHLFYYFFMSRTMRALGKLSSNLNQFQMKNLIRISLIHIYIGSIT